MSDERKITVEDTPAEPEPKVTTTETTTTETVEDDGKDTSNEEDEG